MIRVGDIARIIEESFPLAYAQPGDNCGLQIGERRQTVRGILVALDASPEALRRARNLRANLLVTHHPVLYAPPRCIDTSSLEGAVIRDALVAGIAVYSAHTNLDAAPGGLASTLAERVGLRGPRHFPSFPSGRWMKITVFVPEDRAEEVHRAMATAGAGRLGNYDMCAFAVSGEGMFRPLAGARPAKGVKNRLERLREVRIEMLLDEGAQAAVTAAMKETHPYEQVAYDLVPVQFDENAGIGCMGSIRPVGARSLARRLSAEFAAEARLSGRPPPKVRTVAVVPGSGGSSLGEARARGADLMVTGEVRYHEMLQAEQTDMGIIELGHDRSEMPAVDLLAGLLRRSFKAKRKKVPVAAFKRPAAAKALRAVRKRQ